MSTRAVPTASACVRSGTRRCASVPAPASAGRGGNASVCTASGRAAIEASGARDKRTVSSPSDPSVLRLVSPHARPQTLLWSHPVVAKASFAGTYKSGFTQDVNLNHSFDTEVHDRTRRQMPLRTGACEKVDEGGGGVQTSAGPALGWGSAETVRVRPAGIEPAACGLKDRCSLAPRREPLTTELRARAVDV